MIFSVCSDEPRIRELLDWAVASPEGAIASRLGTAAFHEEPEAPEKRARAPKGGGTGRAARGGGHESVPQPATGAPRDGSAFEARGASPSSRAPEGSARLDEGRSTPRLSDQMEDWLL